mgnify:CR=1 FL=1
MLKFKQFIAPCIFFSISAGAAAQIQQVHNTPAAAQETAGAAQHFPAVTAAKAKAPNPSAELEIATAKRAAEADAAKKAEAKKIASTAKKDFENKIKRVWDTPTDSAGKTATARITLTESGAVRSVIVSSSDPDMKASIEAAIRAAAPYPMPSDPDARREAQNLTSTFRSSN